MSHINNGVLSSNLNAEAEEYVFRSSRSSQSAVDTQQQFTRPPNHFRRTDDVYTQERYQGNEYGRPAGAFMKHYDQFTWQQQQHRQQLHRPGYQHAGGHYEHGATYRGGRGRAGRQPYRGRGTDATGHHHDYSMPGRYPMSYERSMIEPDHHHRPHDDAASMDGTRPKQFSYQRNRYRENRQQRSSRTESNGIGDASANEDDALTNGKQADQHLNYSSNKTKHDVALEQGHDQSSVQGTGHSVTSKPASKPARYGETRAKKTERKESARDRPVKKLDSLQNLREKHEQSSDAENLSGKEVSGDAVSTTKKEKPNSGHQKAEKYAHAKDKNKSHIIKEGHNKFRIDYSRRIQTTKAHKAPVNANTANVVDGNAHVATLHTETESQQGNEKVVAPKASAPAAAAKTKPPNKRRTFNKKSTEDVETFRGTLIEELFNNTYECMVCCDVIRKEVAVWSCGNCYHIFHLRCIKKWARSPTAVLEGGTGWRCPACQNVSERVPSSYRCFCARVLDPEANRFDTPHSCGEVCRKKRGDDCIHLCNILCHPGPCIECNAMVTRHCFCGKTSATVKCSQATNINCQEECGKTLNCGRHDCKSTCHKDSCPPCEQIITQVCYCGADKRDVVCGTAESFTSSFCCQAVCGRKLACGNHYCNDVCHPGTCSDCRLLPDAVRYCACLKTPLDELLDEGKRRSSCLDPVPTCQQRCEKELKCGPKDAPHLCQLTCHTDSCGSCSLQTDVKCACGTMRKSVPCAEISKYSGEEKLRCDKRCGKKRDCGRHRCQNTCCTDEEHRCDLICNKWLSCGLHRCEEPCHRGNCHRCWQVSFDELLCHCGAEVLMPPVPCGARPPECRQPCIRPRPCGHEPRHPCHSDDRCPPCTQLVSRLCMGGHVERKNIACHLSDVSCGMRCLKPLACGHKCQLTCHKGDCGADQKACTQLCATIREECGHPCSLPCHDKSSGGGGGTGTTSSSCPPSLCRVQVTVTCDCGNHSEKMPCHTTRDSQQLSTAAIAMTHMDGQGIDIRDLTNMDGQGIDIRDLTNSRKTKKLECDADCAIKERNKRMAEALEIDNADVSNKPGVTYSDFLKDYAKKNQAFVASVEKALSDLVITAQKGAHKSRSHSFTTMRSEQRRFVHELAELYGCTTQSYDEEPQRNVVATAVKDKCHRLAVTLTTMTQRELNQKAPTPIPHRSTEQHISGRSSIQTPIQTKLPGAWGMTSSRPASSAPAVSSRPTSSMTTLTKNSSSSYAATANSCNNNSTPRSESPASHHVVNTAWSRGTRDRSAVNNMAAGAGGASSCGATASKSQPVIDYFDMTD